MNLAERTPLQVPELHLFEDDGLRAGQRFIGGLWARANRSRCRAPRRRRHRWGSAFRLRPVGCSRPPPLHRAAARCASGGADVPGARGRGMPSRRRRRPTHQPRGATADSRGRPRPRQHRSCRARAACVRTSTLSHSVDAAVQATAFVITTTLPRHWLAREPRMVARAVSPATPTRRRLLATPAAVLTGRPAPRSTPGSVAGSHGAHDGGPCGSPITDGRR